MTFSTPNIFIERIHTLRKAIIISSFVAVIAAGIGWFHANAQTEPTLFRVGERLTYNVSFGKFPNVAYAETYVFSRGKIGGKDAVEIQSRVKTLDFVSAAFMMVDRGRSTFASPSSGSPLFIKDVENNGGMPRETTVDLLKTPASGFDLNTIIYKIRMSGGAGSLTLIEGEKTYSVTFQTVGSETVKTDAGDFQTSIIDVQSEYLKEIGFTGLKINLSTEGAFIPILYRLKTPKGEFRAAIASIQVAPEPTPLPVASPTPVQTPRPTPRPSPTAEPYIDNRPLSDGMPFALGESLEYSVMLGARRLGAVTLSAKERKLIGSKDSLVLNALVSRTEPGAEIFRQSNGFKSNVDPEVLVPYDVDVKFDGPLAAFSQSAKFNQQNSSIVVTGGERIDAPVGTHNILSLVYAMRLFNLNPSKTVNNPVNDTRVAVFWQGRPYIFTLRPSDTQVITIGGEKFSAQQISVSTGNSQLDQLSLKVWLSSDSRRLPLRFAIGGYQLDINLTGSVLPE